MSQSKYRKALNKVLLNLVEQVQPLQEKYREMCEGPMNDYMSKRAQELIDKINRFKSLALEEVRTAYEEYLKRLDKKAKSISGADIDKADVQLLESSLYTLNQEEFDVFQDKYEGNRSMERLLAGYAKKKNQEMKAEDNSEIKNFLVCRFLSDEDKKLTAYLLYKECATWIENDDGYGVADYVINMAGDMFVAADKLKE